MRPFASSVPRRTEDQVVDPAHRWSVRVEQSFMPAIELTRAQS